MIEIPQCMRNDELRFVKLIDGKKPCEPEWQIKNNYKYDDPKILEWIQNGGNFGILCGIGGLIVIDADTPELRERIEETLPKTLTVKTGSGGSHFYYICPEISKKIVLIKNNKHYGEIQSTGTQVVGPSCIHPNGNTYQIINNGGIHKIDKENILSAVYDFQEEKKQEVNEYKRENTRCDDIRILDVINTAGMNRRGNELYGSHPTHGSNTGSNFYVNDSDNLWHCFRCNSGGGPLHWIAVQEGLIQCHESRAGALKGELFVKVLKIAKEKYHLKISELPEIGKVEITPMEKNVNDALGVFNDYIKMGMEFITRQPLYYDKSRMWWVWDFEEYKWKMIDETDIMILIDKNVKQMSRTTESSVKNEILEALRRVAREMRPSNVKETWIQFKDRIIDIETGEECEVSSKYFATNPIDWRIGKSCDTPVMDKVFEEWVGKGNRDVLYEIIAFALSQQYFIHRLFCLAGSGMNGKSTYFNIIKKFIGEDNVTSTELDDLLERRFEKAKLYKKLLCFMGETNFGTMKRTSTLKKLTGEDLIGFEFKNKDPFTGVNYAKLLVATNSVPTTNDRTIGFYRRWLTIDFPNNFEGRERNIMAEIPDEEYENLAKKCIEILRRLRNTGKFTNEGTIADRKRRFEEKANPMAVFINEKCEKANSEEMPFWDFYDVLRGWMRDNGHREWGKAEVSRELSQEGFEIVRKSIKTEDYSYTTKIFISGLRLKMTKEVQEKLP